MVDMIARALANKALNSTSTGSGSPPTDWTYTATVDNTTSFNIDGEAYDYTKDYIQLFFQGTLLILNDNYTISGLSVTLISGWSLNNGESITVLIYK